MRGEARDDLAALLPPLLQSLEILGFIARNLYPPDFETVMQAVGNPAPVLRAVRTRLRSWPDDLAEMRDALGAASDAALAGFAGVHEALEHPDGVRAVFRALRHLPQAMEVLYPLAAALPQVNRFFIEPALRDDAALQARLAAVPGVDTGVLHFDNEPGTRGGFSVYVPEYDMPDRAWPLVVALHGGSGNGRAFLWSWLREARGHGAIVVAPTATGSTWALMGEDADTPNLDRILGLVAARWTIDPARILLTGMSDGGTFSYVTGLQPDSAFTHLAPVAASFHPVMAQIAEPRRIGGLPIFLVHGALDWMFPVRVAREAARGLSAAGARVTYRELDDLSHCYPRELNSEILAWLAASDLAR